VFGRLRAVVGAIGLIWFLVLLAWWGWAMRPRHLAASSVSPARWRQARQQTAPLPLTWQHGHGTPPLLPVSGDLFVRREMTALNGLALVPGTFGCRDVQLTIEFQFKQFQLYGKLGRPLLPFAKAPADDFVLQAQAVELLCGIQDPARVSEQGLHVRWDDQLRVYGADPTTPLFPGRGGRLRSGTHGPAKLSLMVRGNRVVVSLGDDTVMDFHTTAPVTGAVGVAAYQGAVSLERLEVSVPGGPEP
jgi:hypothetical protein